MHRSQIFNKSVYIQYVGQSLFAVSLFIMCLYECIPSALIRTAHPNQWAAKVFQEGCKAFENTLFRYLTKTCFENWPIGYLLITSQFAALLGLLTILAEN